MEPQFPHDENKQPQNEIGGNAPRRLPEFVIIEEDEIKQDPLFERLKHKKPVQVPFKIRFLCFLIGLMTFIWTFGALCCCLISGLLASLLFLKNESFNELFKTYWRYVKGGTAVTTGLFIAIFSPYLGFILIFSYFLLLDPSWQRGMLANLLRSQFGDYLS